MLKPTSKSLAVELRLLGVPAPIIKECGRFRHRFWWIKRIWETNDTERMAAWTKSPEWMPTHDSDIRTWGEWIEYKKATYGTRNDLA